MHQQVTFEHHRSERGVFANSIRVRRSNVYSHAIIMYALCTCYCGCRQPSGDGDKKRKTVILKILEPQDVIFTMVDSPVSNSTIKKQLRYLVSSSLIVYSISPAHTGPKFVDPCKLNSPCYTLWKETFSRCPILNSESASRPVKPHVIVWPGTTVPTPSGVPAKNTP